MTDHPIFRVVFVNNGKTYEVYAKSVTQGNLYGFVEIQQILFNNRSGILVDPSEEKLKAEFQGVKSTQIPIHSVIRIDEVDKQGVAKIGEASNSVVTPFPLPNTPNKS
ncbi:MAG: DUF1820 family protein [Kangiellaceae bacterium]|jgi:hypothetical protein